MSFVEDFGQRDKEDAAAAAPPADREPKQPSVREILADDEQSKLYGAYLEKYGSPGIGERLVKGEPDPADLKELEKKRKDFFGVMDREKKMEAQLDEKAISELIESSPELKQIANLVGADRIRGAFIKALPEMAIKNLSEFGGLESALAALAKTKESAAVKDKEIQALCGKFKLTEAQYMEALRSSDPNALGNLIKRGVGPIGMIFKGKAGRAQLDKDIIAAKDTTAIKRLLAQTEGDKTKVGSVLAATLLKNDGLRKSLIGEIRGEEVDDKEGASFADMRDALGRSKKVPQESARKAYAEYLKKHRKDKNFSQEEAPKAFAEEYTEKNFTKGKGGFWAAITKLFFVSAIEDILGEGK